MFVHAAGHGPAVDEEEGLGFVSGLGCGIWAEGVVLGRTVVDVEELGFVDCGRYVGHYDSR